MKFDLRSWLVKKIAGDRLVILNATIIYKYFPVFADTDLKPIIDKCNFNKHDKVTPFAVYASHMFDKVDDSIELKPKYKEVYENVINEIVKEQDAENPDTTDEEKKGSDA